MKKTIFTLTLLLALFVVACSGSTSPGFAQNNPATTDFYKGTQGIEVRYESFPNRLFFYSEPGNAGNQFEIGVAVENRGGSWARGAIFLSGYDPNLIQFDEVPLLGGQLSACGVSIGSLGFGDFGGIFQCEGFGLGGTTDGDFFLNVDRMSSFMGEHFKDSNLEWLRNLDLSASSVNGQTQFNLNFNDPNFDFDYWGHGRFFISLFSGVDFISLLGREFVLPGRSYEYPGGGVDYLTYTGNILGSGWSRGLDEIRQPILMTSCYYYTTHAAPLVCIDPDPYSDNRKVCNPQQLSFSGSQGAPVAITSVEQENSPRKAVFRITVQNVGNGEVYDLGDLQKCSPYIQDRVRPSDKDVVYLGDIRIGNQRLTDCTPDGVIRLQNGRGTITCSYPLQYVGLKSAYETPLYVELWYGYSETQQRDLVIKRLT